MGVNLSEATPDKHRHKRFGKNYWDIDFYPSDSLTATAYKDQWEKGAHRPVVGELQLGNKRIPVTLKELEKLRETITDAMYTTDMSYRLGMLK